MAVVNFGGLKVKSSYSFSDLDLNDSFRIIGHKAVYLKVHVKSTVRHSSGVDMMLEVATGNVFPATSSRVELIPVEINVGVAKPDIY